MVSAALVVPFVQGNFSLILTCQCTEDFMLAKTFCFVISHRAMNFVLLKAVIMQKYDFFFSLASRRTSLLLKKQPCSAEKSPQAWQPKNFWLSLSEPEVVRIFHFSSGLGMLPSQLNRVKSSAAGAEGCSMTRN